MNICQIMVLMFSVLFFGMGIWAMIETNQIQRKKNDIHKDLYIQAFADRMKYNDMAWSLAEKKHKRRNSFPDLDLKREFASDQANPYI